jgi:raffinose/stachyose/melibiose transport system substrate-binding protein
MSSSTQASGQGNSQIQTSGFDKLGPVTLNVIQGETGDARLNTTKCVISGYEKKYPNVTINVQFKDLNSHLQTVKLEMTSSNPPDVVQGNQGWDILPPLIKANAIVNFDDYNSAYGWDKKFAPDVIRPNKYSTDGTKFGEGSLWGLSPFSEFVGIYYNKDLLQKLGVTDVSTISTLDAFNQILAKAKAQGMQPIILGDADKLTANHFFGEMLNDYWDPQQYSNWIYGAAGSNIVNQDAIDAVTAFQAWYKNGYINQDVNALQRTDAFARFGQGQGVFLVSGNWAVQDVDNGLKDKAGFMLFPTGKTNKKVAIGSINLPWIVSSKSKYKDLAVNFVDFATTSNEAIDCMMQNGVIPAVGIPQGKTYQLPVANATAAAYNQLVSSGGSLVPWMDWPTPRMLDVLGSGVQQMMVGQMQPQQFLQTLQTEWDSFYKNKK